MKENTAPKHLKPATKKWFQDVIEAFHMDAHHVANLSSYHFMG